MCLGCAPGEPAGPEAPEMILQKCGALEGSRTGHGVTAQFQGGREGSKAED